MKTPNVRAKLQQLGSLVRTHRAQFATLATNAVLTVVILTVAAAAGERMDRLKENRTRVAAVHEALTSWPKRYAPASDAERQQWARSAADLSRLGVRPEDRLFLAQLLSRRAEDAGIFDARVKFTSATGGADGRTIGARAFRSASYGVQVDCQAPFPAVVEYIAQLPAAVSITGLGMQRAEGGLVAQFALEVFEPVPGAQ